MPDDEMLYAKIAELQDEKYGLVNEMRHLRANLSELLDHTWAFQGICPECGGNNILNRACARWCARQTFQEAQGCDNAPPQNGDSRQMPSGSRWQESEPQRHLAVPGEGGVTTSHLPELGSPGSSEPGT